MSISDLIAKLQDIRDEHGDIEVYVRKEDWAGTEYRDPSLTVTSEYSHERTRGEMHPKVKNELMID